MADAVTVSLAGPMGMIGLRGDLTDPALRATVTAFGGCAFPERGQIEGGATRGLAWMSPDEVLLLLPHDEVDGAMARIAADLAAVHHLAADTSDLRACLILEGPGAREVLGKLAPADLHPDAFGPGVIRRTHLGQVAAAFWLEGDGARVLCFRSVRDYALALLRQSAADGAVGYF